MRRFLSIWIAVVCLCVGAGAQGPIIHGNGDPTTNKVNCAFSRFYVDDSTGKLYQANAGSPCVWSDPAVTGLQPANNLSDVGSVAQARANLAGTTPGISVFGDSNAAGSGSTPQTPFPLNAHPWQLHLKVGGPFYWAGQVRSGDMCLDTDTRIMQRTLPQGNGLDPVIIDQSVTNDIAVYGATANLQNVFQRCALNAMAWSAIPAANKVLGGSMTLAGGFAVDTNGSSALQPNMGAVCTTNGCTAQTTITTQQANAPICIGYLIKDGNGGTATFKIDGVNQTDPFSASTTFNFFGDGAATIATTNGLTQGPVASCFNVAAAGAHTVLITGTSATSASNIVEVYWAGTAPPVSATNPRFIYITAIPRTDGFSGNVVTYNNFIQTQITNVTANGGSTLNIALADAYSAMVNIPTQVTLPTTQTTATYTATSTWVADVGVAYQNGLGLSGTPLTKVASAPAVGQYSVAAGVYTFNSADFNRPLLVSYTVNCGSGSAATAAANCNADTIHPNNTGHAVMATVLASKFPASLVQGPTLATGYQPSQNFTPNGLINPSLLPSYADPFGMTGTNFGVKRYDSVSGPNFDYRDANVGWTHAIPNSGATIVECWYHYGTGVGVPITLPSGASSCDLAWQANGIFQFNSVVQVQSLTITKSGLTGTIALPTAAITAGTCSAAATLAVGGSGVSSTTAFAWSFNSDPSAITGYPSLNVFLYGTANTINVKVCNPTAGSITPSAATINVRAIF